MKHLATRFAVCALVAAALPAAADPPAFPDFEARRVKPPKPGTKKRILVQITAPAPRKLAPASPAPATEEGSASGAPAHGWFWTTVSAKYEARNPGRLEEALAALDSAPAGQEVRAPRLQDLQKIAAAQGVEILKATVGTRVSPALALAVISVESGGRIDAVSSAGAQGLMQLMPATAARFGVSDSGLASENIAGGVRFLDFLIGKFDGDPILVLAGYNAGENAIGKHGGVPPYAETRDYVPKVLAAWTVAQGLCKTPPMFISDGCVFVTMN